MFAAVIRDAIEKRVDFVLVSGDMFHSRSMDPSTYLQALGILQEAKEAGIPVIAIEGNHDLALHKDKVSWLYILESQGLLRLLRIKKADGLEILGDHAELTDARIFGVRYIGYSTKTEIAVIAKDIANVNEKHGKKSFTCLLMHFGMEGTLKRNISGEIALGSLEPLKGLVDYLALGHYHIRYEYDGWVYNGGSPEMVSMDEYPQEKGYYNYNGKKAEFIDTRALGRPVHRIPIDVTDAASEMDLRTRVQTSLLQRMKDIQEGAMVDLLLSGRANIARSAFDVASYEALAKEKLKALHVNVKMQVQSEKVDVIERELEGLERRQMEEEVLTKMVLADDRYKPHAKKIVAGMLDIKDLVVSADRPEGVLEDIKLKLGKMFADAKDSSNGLPEIPDARAGKDNRSRSGQGWF